MHAFVILCAWRGCERKAEQLTELNLLDCQLASVDEIRNLALATQLRSLNLHFNRITVIHGLDSLASSLTSLDVSANLLEDVGAGLSQLFLLKTLNLSSNKVRGVYCCCCLSTVFVLPIFFSLQT